MGGTVLAAVGLAAVSVGLAWPLLALVGRLPEPEPDPEPVAGEPPKPLWADLAAEPRWRRVVLAVAAALGLVVGAATGPTWTLLLLGPLAPVGAVLALVDLRTRLLPKRLVWPVTGVAVLYAVVAWLVSGSADDLVRALGGMALAWGVLGALWWLVPAGVGLGDVRMVGWLGFVLGHLGPTAYVVGLYSPFLLFGVPGLVLAVVRRDRALLRRAFPFGPFLVAGAVLGAVLG